MGGSDIGKDDKLLETGGELRETETGGGGGGGGGDGETGTGAMDAATGVSSLPGGDVSRFLKM